MPQPLSLDREVVRQNGIRAVRELCRLSFHTFVRYAWGALFPGESFVDGKHIRGICDTLQAVTEGRVKEDVIFNLPPGHMKSLLVNVFWPAWVWGPRDMPRTSWMFASHSQALIVRDSQKRRDLIESDWYQVFWAVRLRADENSKLKYENTSGGWMLSITTGGQGTGVHPDYLVIDDPHNTSEVTDAKIERITSWWQSKIGSRGVGKGVKRVLIMQRVDRRDLTAVWKDENPNVVLICLPLEWSPDRMRPTPNGFMDWRTVPGQKLWPEYFDAEKEARLRRSMTPAVEAAQLDQRPPAQRGGADWPVEYFDDRIWFDDWGQPEQILRTVIALDPSMGKTETSDFQAFVVNRATRPLGSDGRPREDRIEFHCDMYMERMDPHGVACKMVELATIYRPQSIVVEDNGFQSLLESLIQIEAQRRGIVLPIRGVTNGSATGKRARVLNSLTAVLKERCLKLKRGSPHNETARQQMEVFPGGRYDDGPDALAMSVDEHLSLWAGEQLAIEERA